MNEITRLLNRWFAEHRIDPKGFSLILNFQDGDAGIRFDVALQRELAETSFTGRTSTARLDLSKFQMNGIKVRIESPIHEPQP